MLIKSELRELVVLGSLSKDFVDLALIDLERCVMVQPWLHLEVPHPAAVTEELENKFRHGNASLRLRVDSSVTHKKGESNEAFSFLFCYAKFIFWMNWSLSRYTGIVANPLAMYKAGSPEMTPLARRASAIPSFSE